MYINFSFFMGVFTVLYHKLISFMINYYIISNFMNLITNKWSIKIILKINYITDKTIF